MDGTAGLVWAGPMFSAAALSLDFLLRRQKNTRPKTTAATTASPPTTPPTIAPIGFGMGDDDVGPGGAGVLEEGATGSGDEVAVVGGV